MKLIRSSIGRHVNRETEQHLLNLICSFLAYEQGSGYANRLHVFIRKNRYMGIYVEHFELARPTHVLFRSIFKKTKWRQTMSPETEMAMRHLRNAELYSIAGGSPLYILPLLEQLVSGCQRLSMY